MNLLSRDELQSLISEQGNTCVSLFMPTHRFTTDTQQDPTRLKNLLRDAEGQLQAKGLQLSEVDRLLTPARKLVKQPLFWRGQSTGLALFLSPETFRYYRLPLEFEVLVVVGGSFHVKPLVKLFTGGGRFFVLAVSQNQVRLLDCTPYSVRKLAPKDVPHSLNEALRFNEEEKHLEFHAGSPGGRIRQSTVIQGQGIGSNASKHRKDILEYFKKIDRGLQKLLKGQHAPLVFAGVEYLLPLYKEANRYPRLLEKGVSGSPDRQSARELQKQAWTIVQPYFRRELHEAVGRYERAVSAGRASTDTRAIVRGAYGGRVGLLFVTVGRQRWGHFDRQTQGVHLGENPAAGDGDLLNFAAVHTLLHRGTVYAQEPKNTGLDAELAAVLRY